MAPTVTVTGAPVQEYVLKVASRCNLACDHCYVYADPGQDWLRLPVVIEPATVRAAAARIAEHAQRHGQRQVSVILHGGEPLLVGPARLAQILTDLRSAVDPVADVQIHVQSNGIRLSRDFCEVLAEHDVKVGISLDGDEIANDRHRKFANGAGSHRQVRQALALLRTPEYRALYGGLLCTVDLANDPVRVYRALLREEPPRIDFLLPHGTWDQPPPRSTATEYADWLLAVFDCWSADGRPVPVRIFDSILALKAGRGSGTESLGPDADSVAVIETDGTWEQVDSLKVVSELAARTGLDVWQHSVDQVIGHNRDGRGAPAELCGTCRSCAVVDVCGGGLYAHRFGRGNGFDNPSVYCADLLHLIPRVEAPSERTGFATAQAQALTDGELTELARGRPGAGALARLNDLQYALDRVLIAEVAKIAAGADGPAVALWDRLADLERESPASVRAVLGYPFVRAQVRQLLKTIVPQREGASEVLAAVVAAVAVRAGAGGAVEVPVRQRMLVLPGIGTLDLARSGFEQARMITVEPGPAGFEVCSGGDRMLVRWPADTEGPAGWTRVRVASRNPSLSLDDVSPQRGCFRYPVTSRLAEVAAEQWLIALANARKVLQVKDSGLDRAIGALVGVVTPVRVAPGRPARASSAREAFGAVALGDPGPVAATLAALLVRQVAWSAVVAIHEVCPLTAPGESRSENRGQVSALAGLSARIATADWARTVGRSGTIAHVVPDNDSLVDELERHHGWSEAGRALLAGLRERAAG